MLLISLEMNVVPLTGGYHRHDNQSYVSTPTRDKDETSRHWSNETGIYWCCILAPEPFFFLAVFLSSVQSSSY